MKIKVGKSYHIYVKLPGRKRFRPMSGENTTLHLIHADIFNIEDVGDLQRFMNHLKDLRMMNSGRFQAREVEWN